MKPQAIVIGGGVHGLAAATLLARAGRKVTLLEARGRLGGRAATEEFHPGFHAPGLDHEPARLSRRAFEALDLHATGLQTLPHPSPMLAAEPEGPGLLLDHDPARARAELSVRDGQGYARWLEFQQRVRPVLAKLLEAPAPDPFSDRGRDQWQLVRSALDLRKLGRDDMLELLRVAPMCAADWLDEYFESPLLKAALSTAALRAGVNGPWAPHTAGLLLLRRSAGDLCLPGRTAALSTALEGAAQKAGCELRCDAPVESLRVSAGRVDGVVLRDGGELGAELVVSALDPRRTLGDLVPARALEPGVLDELEAYRCRGSTAVLRLALCAPLFYRSRPGVLFEHATLTGDQDDLERAFDALKYGTLPARPWLDVRIPSVSQPGLAPAGAHVVTIEIHAVPEVPRDGGWTDERKRELEDLVLRRLAEYSDLPAASIVARELWTPADIEREYGLTGGHLLHGEVAFDQLLFMRPGVACSRHRTPIEGLLLAGPGTHPGGLLCLEPAVGAIAGLEPV